MRPAMSADRRGGCGEALRDEQQHRRRYQIDGKARQCVAEPGPPRQCRPIGRIDMETQSAPIEFASSAAYGPAVMNEGDRVGELVKSGEEKAKGRPPSHP